VTVTSPTEPVRSRHVVPAILAGILATLLLAAGGAIWLTSDTNEVVHAAASEPVPVPALTAGTPSGPRTAAPWDAPLTLTAHHGTLKDVTALDPDGVALEGRALDPSSWQSTSATLLPAATYKITATVVDEAGEARPMTLTVQTTPAARILKATLNPGDGSVVGVGMPLAVRLNHPVKNAADRAAVVSRLTVTTTPAVQGAWRWMENDELHYRGATFWKAGTTISLVANLRRLQLSDGTWGSGIRTTSYSVGDALVSTVDVNKHIMVVRRNGAVLRTLKVSTGRDEYPTHNGVHIVIEKVKLKTMDSSTIGIPRNSPGGYYLKVPNSVRISNSGEFVHAAPGTVRQQGVANVSHGCVNVAPADAAWFYSLAKRGDVVTVIGSPRKPISWDAGTADWNVPFAEWAN
jgi:lipoprotein-anchoring transpeptidase ErfK/SrfK